MSGLAEPQPKVNTTGLPRPLYPRTPLFGGLGGLGFNVEDVTHRVIVPLE